MNIKKLKESIEKIGESFHENELAYLSLTSKNEHVIRDKIAHQLHLELNKSKYIIAREYKRIDLAILENNSEKNSIVLKDIIELKSMFTFDAKKGFGKYINIIETDFKKNDKFVDEGVNQYEIIIATYPKASIETLNDKCKYKGIIKYYNDIKKYIDEEDLLKNNMDEKIKEAFKEGKYDMIKCNINAGKAFDIEVYVYFWIMKKIK